MRASLILPAVPAFICLLVMAAVGLRFGSDQAQAATAAWQREQLQQAIANVQPVAHDNDPIAERVELTDAKLLGLNRTGIAYPLRAGGAPVGAVLELDARDGYNGDIRLLVGVDPEGRVTRVLVVSHQETSGFGDAIEAGKSDWNDIFIGRALAGTSDTDWRERDAGGKFDAISGATMTSRSMIAGVHAALRIFEAKRAEIFASP